MGSYLRRPAKSAPIINDGQLAPGTHLVEDALASDHDVSRGPVRDAFKVLLAEGLVDNRRRGFFVRGFTADDIEELYALREAVEQLACRLTITAAPMDWSPAERDLDLHPSADDHRLLLTLAQTGQSTEFAATLSAHLAGSKERMRAAIADRQPRASAD